jgi:hypothetical protein
MSVDFDVTNDLIGRQIGAESATDGDFELQIFPRPDEENHSSNDQLEKFFFEINISLGGDSIELDLSDDDYKFAFNRSLEELRGLSTRSIYESLGFLHLTPNVQIYRVHRAIDNVISVYRKRALFDSNNTGFDYFSQIAAGMIYPGAQPGGYMGIATYDFALQYEETLNRLFARELRWRFFPWNHTIVFDQVPRSTEMVVMRCAVLKNINELMQDHWSRLWLQKWTTAVLKSILGNKWGKFPQLPGAQGEVQINWQKFAQEAQVEMKELKEQIYRYEDGGTPPYPMMM